MSDQLQEWQYVFVTALTDGNIKVVKPDGAEGYVPDQQLIITLDKFGQEGWEVVREDVAPNSTGTTYVLKRPTTLLCGECFRLQEALIGKLSAYAALLKAGNDHHRNGNSEGARQASMASYESGLEVTDANDALEKHRDRTHRPGIGS